MQISPQTLQRKIAYSLSNYDILKLTNYETTIHEFPDLIHMDSLHELFGQSGAAVILIETATNRGHWICCLESNGTFEWFDSYGLRYGAEMKYVSEEFKEQSGEHKSVIDRLIKNSDYSHIIYNGIQLQDFSKEDNSCGRFCAVRVNMRDMPLKEFQKYLTSQKGLTPTDVVVSLTWNVG